MVASCVSSGKYYPVPEYQDYSETIDIPGMDAAVIYAKTKIWLEERRAFFLSYSPTLSVGIFGGTFRISFNIENEQCQLIFNRPPDEDRASNEFYGYEKNETARLKDARKEALDLMDAQKNLAAEYRAFITTPLLSQEEIDALIAKGDEAFDKNQFSTASKHYSEALQSAPTNVYILIANGLCFQQLSESSREIETFVIDTNRITSVFTNEGIYGAYLSGQADEESRLEDAYEDVAGNLNRALEMYNRALSVEPNNETAVSCAAYIKQRKAYIDSRHSQLKTALNNIRNELVAERQRIMAQQREATWNQLLETLGNFTNSVAQVQQNQSGGRTGGVQAPSGTASGATAGGSSASGRGGNANEAAMRNNYNRRANAAQDVYFQLQNASTADEVARLGDALRSHQRDLRAYREQCRSKGVDIQASMYETAWPR
jgi:hypothetical protein